MMQLPIKFIVKIRPEICVYLFVYVSGLRARLRDLFDYVGGLRACFGTPMLTISAWMLTAPFDADCVKLIWVGMIWRCS